VLHITLLFRLWVYVYYIMIKIVVVIALLAFTQGFLTFKEFKDKYSKHYQTEEEELYR
jgi:hypothetical protein